MLFGDFCVKKFRSKEKSGQLKKVAKNFFTFQLLSKKDYQILNYQKIFLQPHFDLKEIIFHLVNLVGFLELLENF